MYKRQARDLAQEGRRGADRLVTILADSAGYLSTLAFVRISVETTAALLATLAMGQIFAEVWQILGTCLLYTSILFLSQRPGEGLPVKRRLDGAKLLSPHRTRLPDT